MAKRIASSSVKWDLLNKYVYPDQKPRLMQLKMQSDKFFKKVSALPPELPKIDWSIYKDKISKPGMVENFQKSYGSLQVPYPGDAGMIASIDKVEAEAIKKYEADLKKVKENINKLEEKAAELSKIKPASDMIYDEYQYHFPKNFDCYNDIFPVGEKKDLASQKWRYEP